MRQDADDDSVAKLIHILKMLDSQVILDYSNSGLQGDVHMERNIKKPEGRNRPRHTSITKSGTIKSDRQTFNLGPETINEDEYREDIANQRSLMERKNIFPLLLSPVLSSSNFKSPPRPRTSKPGPASKTGRMKAGSRSIIGTQTVSSKPIKVHKCDRNLSNQTKERSDDPQEIERLTVKEKPDDGPESPLSPAFDDVRNDETSNVAKTDNSIQTCPSCNKEFSKKGRLQAHISQAHPNHYIHYECPHCD